jgi:hypothetical protein
MQKEPLWDHLTRVLSTFRTHNYARIALNLFMLWTKSITPTPPRNVKL